MRFGQHLRGLRQGAGLSRAELARSAGVPVSTLRSWEAEVRGRRDANRRLIDARVTTTATHPNGRYPDGMTLSVLATGGNRRKPACDPRAPSRRLVALHQTAGV
jgi:transcriptional regulator with XRE-family HTH domain